MGVVIPIGGGGGGTGSDECTAKAAEVLEGRTAVTNDSDDEAIVGTMPNNGEIHATLLCGERKEIPAGYTTGGMVEAADLASQTGGATASAGDVLVDKSYWKDGVLEEGTMPDNGEINAALNCGDSKTIPAGYTSGGKITVNSLASQTGGATAEDKYVYNGKTYWKDGVKRTGNMTCSSVLSFSVAAYSTSQVVATWKNPASGPFSGVIICAKTGSYPTGINDNRKYTGVGSNKAASGTSSATISGLTAGTTYYFRIWAYTTCSAGDFYSGYLQATCAPTAHGRKAFTSSGTFTVPTAVRSINIHCTGGGGSGGGGSYRSKIGGRGGGGGRTYYKNNISVNPDQKINIVVGAGGTPDSVMAVEGNNSSVTIGTTTYSALGGNKKSDGATYYGNGGSGGGGYGSNSVQAGNGGSNGGDGGAGAGNNGAGQGTTTKEFGSGTLYSGGGGGGGWNDSGSGGSGGGGAGSYYAQGSSGSAGTGGGGGGGASNGSLIGGSGGSGNVIITW